MYYIEFHIELDVEYYEPGYFSTIENRYDLSLKDVELLTNESIKSIKNTDKKLIIQNEIYKYEPIYLFDKMLHFFGKKYNYNVEIVSSIQERDASVSVPAGTFNDCIIVKRVKTTSGLNVPTTTSTTRYWFAKNKGPVKVETEENAQITSQNLTAYILY